MTLFRLFRMRTSSFDISVHWYQLRADDRHHNNTGVSSTQAVKNERFLPHVFVNIVSLRLHSLSRCSRPTQEGGVDGQRRLLMTAIDILYLSLSDSSMRSRRVPKRDGSLWNERRTRPTLRVVPSSSTTWNIKQGSDIDAWSNFRFVLLDSLADSHESLIESSGF